MLLRERCDSVCSTIAMKQRGCNSTAQVQQMNACHVSCFCLSISWFVFLVISSPTADIQGRCTHTLTTRLTKQPRSPKRKHPQNHKQRASQPSSSLTAPSSSTRVPGQKARYRPCLRMNPPWKSVSSTSKGPRIPEQVQKPISKVERGS